MRVSKPQRLIFKDGHVEKNSVDNDRKYENDNQ